MATLYYYAEKNDYLLVGCTNLSERLIGFYVKYGDDVCDVAPIAHLYKTEVRQLSEYLSVPEDIRNRPPSPDLIPGITDEYSLGVNYETLDQILAGLEEGKTAEDNLIERIGGTIPQLPGRCASALGFSKKI